MLKMAGLKSETASLRPYIFVVSYLLYRSYIHPENIKRLTSTHNYFGGPAALLEGKKSERRLRAPQALLSPRPGGGLCPLHPQF
jgi:hypothetical protein